MTKQGRIGFGTRLTMKSMHNLSKFYSKTRSRKLRVATHYVILGIFFVSILWKHKPTSILKKSSELKFVVSEVLSWVRK